ncbi:unnamed protein product [Parascedosporium putredinis]|uniref:Uncharacterized protein n=1 Tax=Parascedosporium putredinis TaxID=1442378 RepID=A0A9P1GZY5_9PEZI|nr:unnamed protein product [Parascedosporium putredinis]CAI7993413.1 unnamed protein product [Parascedosporium putredinis]
MWAGGEVHMNPLPERRLRLDGSRAACVERILDVSVKKAETENPLVFVSLERRMGHVGESESDEAVRARLLGDDGAVAVRELRDVVFMKAAGPGGKAKTRVLEHKGREDFSHTLTTNPKLLFRYSALTYNTHAIHLDPNSAGKPRG